MFNPSVEKLVRRYLPTIMMSSGTFMSEYDKQQLIKNYVNEFKKYTDSFELNKLERAFQSILNREEIVRLPTPGQIKHIIMEGNKPEYKPMAKKPHVRPEFMVIYKKAQSVLATKEITKDEDIKAKLMAEYWELCDKMEYIATP